MNPAIHLVLLLQSKHLACDGFLQTKEMVHEKGFYGRRLGLLHSGLHALGTLAALLMFGSTWPLAAGMAAADGLVHYHADYIKENIVRMRGWTVADREFWWALMSDQFVHNLTYLAITAFVLSR